MGIASDTPVPVDSTPRCTLATTQDLRTPDGGLKVRADAACARTPEPLHVLNFVPETILLRAPSFENVFIYIIIRAPAARGHAEGAPQARKFCGFSGEKMLSPKGENESTSHI